MDKIPNTTVRGNMEMDKDIIDEVQRLQQVWYGHTVKMDETRLPKKILEWIPPGKRIQGRPRHRWRDDITEL